MFLAWLNYRGVLATLTFNLVITAVAFVGDHRDLSGHLADARRRHRCAHADLMSGRPPCPTAGLGILAAMHFGLWYYLGHRRHHAGGRRSALARAVAALRHAGRDHDAADRGDADLVCLRRSAAVGISGRRRERCGARCSRRRRSPGRPVWCGFWASARCLPRWHAPTAASTTPSRAWFSMGRDHYLPAWFGAVHPVYRTPYRAIIFLVPIALIFALGRAAGSGDHLLDPVGAAGLYLHADQHDHVPPEMAARHDQARL